MSRGLVLSLCVFCVACGSSKDDAGKGKSEPTPPPVVSDAAPPPEKPVPSLAREDVQEIVDAWLAAQNDGDFAAYEDLYAERFTGVKRVGAQEFNYNRAGWLKDRERMFAKKVTVEAADTKIATTPRMAVASFTQTWASGKFRDVGPKQLVIVHEDGTLRIAREEMLSSTVTDAAAAAPALPRQKFAFVFQSGKVPRIILQTDVDGDWGKGAPKLLSRDTTAAVVKAADLSKVSADHKAWIGKQAILYKMNGSDCFGKVAELEVVTGYEPHFGTLQEWQESKASDKRVAAEIWNMGGEARWLTARVEGCEGGGPWVWGQGKSGPPEVLAVAKDPELSKRALARFRGLKGYKAVQKDFANETGKSTPWEEDGLGAKVIVFHAKDDSDFVAVSATAGAGCGEWSGEYWALFSVKGSKLVLLTDETNPGPFFMPALAIDLDGTGEISYFDHGRIVRLVGSSYRLTEDVRLPVYDTPC